MAKVIGKEKTKRTIGLEVPAKKGETLRHGNPEIVVEAVEVKEPKK